MELAQKHFQAVLEMEAHEDLCGLARNGLRQIAVCGLKARGPRMDGGLLPKGACGRCRGMDIGTQPAQPLAAPAAGPACPPAPPAPQTENATAI